MQMFCGVLIDPSNPIKDGKIVSAIRDRHSETLLLFLGIHMANAATLAARQLAAEIKAKEKKRV